MNLAQAFLSFASVNGALQFGEFRLNSGRISPYYLNTGAFSDGENLSQLTKFYAETIVNNIDDEFMLYGPAYKGIPLAAATATSLYREHQMSVPFAFNRKEMKDHGDGGWTVGASLQGKVVIVEDVITSGKSIQSAVETIEAHGAVPAAVVIAMDRMEHAPDAQISAVDQIRRQHSLDVFSIATVYDLIEYVNTTETAQEHLSSISSYCKQYVTQPV